MEFCYGDKNSVRILEEAQFWKRQEAEHTVVIREIVSNLESMYVSKLEELQRVFSQTEGTITQYMKRLRRTCYEITPELLEDILCLIEITLEQSEMFVNYLDMMTKQSQAVRSNPVNGIVVAHIIRESEYYIVIAKAYLRYVC